MTSIFTKIRLGKHIEKGEITDASAIDLNGYSILQLAIAHKRLLARELIRMGANLDYKDKDGLTALHYASSGGDAEMTRELLIMGADPKAEDRHKNTPLWRACFLKGNHAVIRELMAYGSDPNHKNAYGKSPIDLCKEMDEVSFMEILDVK